MANVQKRTGEFFGDIHTDAKLETDAQLGMVLGRTGKKREWFRGKKVIDVGCSNGRTLMALSSLPVKELHGVELSKKSVMIAKERLGKKASIRQGSVLQLPYGDGAFDVVYCSGVIHHTPDPYVAMSELARITKPGGLLVLGVLNKGGPMKVLIKAMRAYGRVVPCSVTKGVVFSRFFGKWRHRMINLVDVTYAPIQFRFNEKDVVEMFKVAGFEGMERVKHTRYNSWVFGGGFIVVRGKKKADAGGRTGRKGGRLGGRRE